MNRIYRLFSVIIIFLFITSTGIFNSYAAAVKPSDTLIDIQKLSSSLVIDLRYATNKNFTGTKLYASVICCLQEATAWKLIKANEEVMKKGYRIKIRDAYRPYSVQKAMWKIMPDSRYLANPNKGDHDKNWTIYEKLKIPEYKYAAVINYNIGPDRIVGNGSAIFLHIAGSKGYTSGCTAVSEADLLTILKWMNGDKKPIIVQGTLSELKSIKL